ncbi:ADP-ribosylation factor-like protein 1 [Babesia caballi]|uniref:ADP-ribosylation factor-like protein 1 n=1 Tax=Babesia caballi TaxID=5871 RepID=A0AAV4LNH9_BABCB|nr:ADP-ribosylation factor-like protein 1 [Babesia caballi]
MGGSLSCIRGVQAAISPAPILQVRLFGLNNSGKTSIVNFLKNGFPAVEGNVDDVETDMQWITHRKVRMLFWLSEQTVQKEIANESQVARALVYVVDGSDPDNLTRARDYLFHQLEGSAGTPNLLILLNKCDKHTFVFLEEAHDALDLDKIRDRHVRIYACSAVTGEGIREGLDWLCSKFYIDNGMAPNRQIHSHPTWQPRILDHNARVVPSIKTNGVPTGHCVQRGCHLNRALASIRAFVPPIGAEENLLYGRQPKANRTSREGCTYIRLQQDGSTGANPGDLPVSGGSMAHHPAQNKCDKLTDVAALTPIHVDQDANGKLGNPEVRKRQSRKRKTVTSFRDNVVSEESNTNIFQKNVDTVENVKSKDTKDDEETSLYVRTKGTSLGEEVASYEDLYSTIEEWGRSSKKSEREMHRFLQRRLKEVKQSAGVQYDDDLEDVTVQDFIDAVEALPHDTEDKTSIPYMWHQYMQMIRSGEDDKIRAAKRRKKQAATELVDQCLRRLEHEEPSGYRYPIVGSPAEVYSDPNIYKAWGRTGLHQTQYLHRPPRTHGMVEQRRESLEDLILSTSPIKNADDMNQRLESVRLKRLQEGMQRLASENPVDPPVQISSKDTPMVCPTGNNTVVEPKFTVTVDGSWTALDENFVSNDRQRQLDLLLALNPYNPWDYFKSMKRMKTGSKTCKPIQVTYRLKPVNIQVNLKAPDGPSDSCGDATSTRLPEDLLRDYLHHFLMFPEDHTMMREIERAEYLHDVLRYFDQFEREDPQPEPEFLDLHDRMFSFVFAGLEGFPKCPPNPQFPLTLAPDGPHEYRVNAINVMVALLQVHKLLKVFTADMFSEQRLKNILSNIHRVLELETMRIKLGVVNLEIAGVDAELCEIDDAYLATLSATLSLWNIRRGIEGIVDSLIILTCARMDSMRPTYLVAIMVNLSNLHTLPRSVFQKFINAGVQHIHRHFAEDLVKCAAQPDHEKWMDFETAAQMLNLLARHRGALSRDLMNKFMRLYEQDFMKLEVPRAGDFAATGGKEGTRMFPNAEKSPETNNTTTIQPSTLLAGPEYWEKLRNAADELTAERHRQSDNIASYLTDEMNKRALRGRVIQYVWSLISCLAWCDLTEQYQSVVEKLNLASIMQGFQLTSVGALAVLQTCSQKTEDGRMLISRALGTLTEVRSTLSDEDWLEAMEVYEEATSPDASSERPRIQRDRAFVTIMFNQFANHRRPCARILRRAVDMLQRLSGTLSKTQRDELFRQMCDVICDYSLIQRQALNAERLEYPLGEIAHVMRVAAECGVRHDKYWKSFVELLNIFKHTLSMDDLREVLMALKAANYTGLADLGELILRRACDIVEVMPHQDAHVICDVMDLALALSIAPTKLLRWFLYLRFYEVPEKDMDRLSMELVGQKLDYEVDFRGWKRPVGHGSKSERVRLHSNMMLPVKMHGSTPYIPSDKLKYVMQQSAKDPAPLSEGIRPKIGAALPRDIKGRLVKVVSALLESHNMVSPADMGLFEMAGVKPPNRERAELDSTAWAGVSGDTNTRGKGTTNL